jgi:limonene-1,2-epoxide hydrolase
MSSDAELMGTANRMIDAWNRRDWDDVMDLFSEDARLHSMMEAEPTVGRAAIRRRIEKLCENMSEVRIEVLSSAVAGSSVFLERVDNFVNAGRPGAMPVVGILEIENGRVREWREYYDRATLLGGMGLERDFVKDL